MFGWNPTRRLIITNKKTFKFQLSTLVIGLASVIIGEVIFGNRFNFLYKLSSIVMGSIIYRIIIAIVLQLGLKATDLKLLTAIIVAIALSVPVLNKKANKILSPKRKG